MDFVDLKSKYIELLTNTINSREKHIVEYAGEFISNKGTNAIIYGMYEDPNLKNPRASVIPDGEHKGSMHISVLNSIGNTGLTASRFSGSYSVLDGKVQAVKRAILSAHEVLGHGVAMTASSNKTVINSNGMRVENLVRRILKMPLDNGSSHSGIVVSPFISPILQW